MAKQIEFVITHVENGYIVKTPKPSQNALSLSKEYEINVCKTSKEVFDIIQKYLDKI